MKNVGEFAERIHKQWIEDGKRMYKQVREGLWEGVGCLDPAPSIWLRFFTAKELKTMFCGDNEILWTEEELYKYVTFHGWDEAIELERRTVEVGYANAAGGSLFGSPFGAAYKGADPEGGGSRGDGGGGGSLLTADNVDALNVAVEEDAEEEAAVSGFGSPIRSQRRGEMLSNLMNNDSEYNGNTTGSEVDSDGELMEVVSPLTFPQSPVHFLPSPKNGMPAQEDEEDFKMRRWLIECLLEMNQKERQCFIEFCTSCPRLPVGGLKALGLKILPEQPGRILPRSRACANTLFLPDYPTRQEFEYHLKLALHDSMGQFEQE